MQSNLVTPGRQDDGLRDDLAATIGFGLAPIAIVLAAGWELRLLILIVWVDTVLAGVQAGAMILRARKTTGRRPSQPVLGALFFAVHYGFFTLGFGLMAMTAYEMLGPNPPTPNPDGSYTMAFDSAGMALAVLSKPILLAPPLAWRILRYRRFLARDEARKASTNGMMGFPYIGAMGFWFVGMQILLGAMMGPDAKPGPPAVERTAFFWLIALRVGLESIETWLRARPEKGPDYAKPITPPPGLYFDARTAPRLWERGFLLAGVALGVAGLLALALAPAAPAGPVMTIFAVGLTLAAYWRVVVPRLQLKRALDEGTARVVEGVVENFVAASQSAPYPTESFSIKGVAFSYRDHVLTGGFDRTWLRGGPVRHGLTLRVHYVPRRDGNVIARLEVRR